MASRGSRSGSAPTPTPPSKQTQDNYYNRRPVVVIKDDRPGPTDKTSGAQAKVNQKFVKFHLKNSFSLF